MSKNDGETLEKTSPSPASFSQGDALTVMRPVSSPVLKHCARDFILLSSVSGSVSMLEARLQESSQRTGLTTHEEGRADT